MVFNCMTATFVFIVCVVYKRYMHTQNAHITFWSWTDETCRPNSRDVWVWYVCLTELAEETPEVTTSSSIVPPARLAPSSTQN